MGNYFFGVTNRHISAGSLAIQWTKINQKIIEAQLETTERKNLLSILSKKIRHESELARI
tara:strand:- start:501 stop:680 length:180 start_codon:yes stop_codon:yes gene_type:complete